METIIYEQVFKETARSFFYRRERLHYLDEFPYHQHPEYEITVVFDGNGQRVTDDFVESFSEGEIIILPPDLPHGWIYDKTLCAPDGTIENAAWQFGGEFLDRLARDFPEFHPVVRFYEDLRQCIEVTGKTAVEVRRLLAAFGRYTEPEQLLALLRVLYLVMHSGDYRYIGQEAFAGTKIHKNKRRLHAIYKYIVENYHRKITLTEIASYVFMNKTAFCLFFRKATNQSFVAYLNAFRLRTACTMLYSTSKNISEICYAVGFSDVPYFNRIFRQHYGMSPTQYRISKTGGEDVKPEQPPPV